MNDAPALIVAANASFIENAAPELLSPSVDLSDLDDADLTFASVQITDGSFTGDGDVLTVGGLTSGTPVTGITFAWEATLHALVFNGTSSVANYQALLQTVGFQSTSNNPTDFRHKPATHPRMDRLGWHGRHGRDVDGQYRRRQRRPRGVG